MDLEQGFAPTVLVVDDQDILTHFMRKALEGSGFRVMAANNGVDALALCRGAEPPVDLLVTDYSMPGMTGVELSRECCRLNRAMGVLYVSGSMPGDDLLGDLDAGRRGFLAKPFRQSDLLRSAKTVLAMEPAGALSGENHPTGKNRLSAEQGLWLEPLSMEG
jgi:two-component system, cell cycle sensor histidine kinase and response regulator CckA